MRTTSLHAKRIRTRCARPGRILPLRSIPQTIHAQLAIRQPNNTKRKIQPGLAHLVLILFACSDVVLNLVPYARGFLSEWPLVRLVNVLLLATCIAAHLVWLRGRALVPERV